jgi:hypothetical protein
MTPCPTAQPQLDSFFGPLIFLLAVSPQQHSQFLAVGRVPQPHQRFHLQLAYSFSADPQFAS